MKSLLVALALAAQSIPLQIPPQTLAPLCVAFCGQPTLATAILMKGK